MLSTLLTDIIALISANGSTVHMSACFEDISFNYYIFTILYLNYKYLLITIETKTHSILHRNSYGHVQFLYIEKHIPNSLGSTCTHCSI